MYQYCVIKQSNHNQFTVKLNKAKTMPIIKVPSKSKLQKLKNKLPVNFQEQIKDILSNKGVSVSLSTVSHVLNGRLIYDKHGILEAAIELIEKSKKEEQAIYKKMNSAIKDND